MTRSTDGYSSLSIALHWLTAIAVIALFFTHEGERDSAMRAFHVGGGAIIGLFLIWRVLRRPLKGFTSKPDQPAILNLVSAIVIWGLLLSILVVTLTGYLLPWSVGQPIDFLGLFSIPSPLERSRDLHEIMEEVHDIAGHAIIPLFVLHLLGALKHKIIDKDGIMERMGRPVSGGK